MAPVESGKSGKSGGSGGSSWNRMELQMVQARHPRVTGQAWHFIELEGQYFCSIMSFLWVSGHPQVDVGKKYRLVYPSGCILPILFLIFLVLNFAVLRTLPFFALCRCRQRWKMRCVVCVGSWLCAHPSSTKPSRMRSSFVRWPLRRFLRCHSCPTMRTGNLRS